MDNQVILLIEDNPDDEALAMRALRKNKVGNQVVVARDGAEALEYLFGGDTIAARELPALVLLDLNLPKVNGLEILRRVREDERTKLLNVVVLTTSNEERDLISSYDLGANSYVRKPVDFAQFVEAVGQLSVYWLVLNEPLPRAMRMGN